MRALKILSAQLVKAVQLPKGKGVTESLNPGKLDGLKMEWEDGALYCDFKGIEFVIPEGNIVALVIDPKEDVIKDKPKK